jgi:DNA repair exonuclease SbcCD ATPase subunit|tara:strand:+ start:3604 stop:5400 length:1797 start_codon:yes stop_codon:yes gene_type:complete
MITLRTLRWSNCFSYGADNELSLDDTTVTQILGTNGMGKSSIPLIIEEALYNKNSKGIKKADIPNRYVNDGYSIQLEFTKDDSRYLIDINRKSSIKVKLEKDGADISSHTATNTYKTIQDIVGIDFKTFSQLVYQNTNASLQFLTATDANRKKFLIDLLHLEKYVELFEVFKAASKDVSTRSTAISSKVATVEKWLNDNKLSDTNILPMLDLDFDTSEDEQALRSVMIEIANISDKNKKITTNNQYKSMLNSIDIGALNDFKMTELESYDHLQEQLGSWQAIAAGAGRTLRKLESIKAECPTCKQSIDISAEEKMLEDAKAKQSNAMAEAFKIKPEITGIKARNDEFRANQKAKKDWEDLFRSVDATLPSSLVDQDALTEKSEELQKRLSEAKSAMDTATTENERRTKRNTRIQVIQEQTDEFKAQLESGKAELAECTKLESNLDVLKKSFSTNGLLAYKIENLVGELEELANEYLADLSDGRFTLEFVVSNDKLNVQITDNGNVVDILALSSGELARVNTATLIAIRKLMTSISKSRINVLFLDEVTNVLDDAGREKLVEVLLREDLNTYIVSHGWSHPLLEKVEVVKDGNISKLER